jgi:glutaredoxin-related protein
LIRGSIENPADDTSKQLVEQMNASKLEYTALDVVAEPEYLKAFSTGQQIPYVFFMGKPACGVDGVSQLLESTDLKKQVATRKLTVIERIEALLKENEVILFMKGTP